MKIHTEDFKKGIKNIGRQIDCKILYTVDGQATELRKKDINSVAMSYDGNILKSVMKKLEIDINNEIPLDTIINFQFALKTRSGKNLFNKNDLHFINGYANTNTNKIATSTTAKMLYIPIEKNTTYTVSKMKSARFNMFTTIDIPEIGVDISNYISDNNATSLTITTSSTARYLVVMYYHSTADTVAEEQILNTIQIENGNIATSYEEYGMYDWLDYGNYIVNKIEKQEDTNSWLITCYDKMLYLMKDYENANITYPITIRSYINALCQYLGIEFKNAQETFANYNKEIQNELYLDSNGNSLGYKFRDVFDELAEVTGSIICINNEDKIEIRYPMKERIGKNKLNTELGFELGYINTSNVFVSDTKTALFNQQIPVIPGQTYTFSSNIVVDNMVISMYNSNNTFKGRQKVTNTSLLVKTIPNDVNYVRFAVNYNNSSTMTQEIINELQLMAEQNTKRTDYEEYTENYIEEFNESYLKDINVKFGEKFGPVNSIVLSRSAESDNIYLKDDESIAQNGLCEIKIKDNQIMNFNDRDQYLSDLLETLDGLEFYMNDFSSTGICYLELGDIYNIKIDNKYYKCLMFNDDIEIKQGLEELIYTERPDKSETDYSKADKTDNKINQTYIMANKQAGEIEALTSRIQNTEDALNNTYTIEQVNTLVQNAIDGVTNQFIVKGGNNIFRNTGLWFENSDSNTSATNPYEYWSGLVVRMGEDKAVNQNALLLQNNTLSQSQIVPNGNYTVSFKYKKLISLADVKVVINDVEYELTEEDDTEFYTGETDINGNYITQPLVVNSQQIKIDFISDTDNACEVYDLMVNSGTSKSEYSQNQNETTTDTVNISKGITITSSDTDTTFKANSDGIRTLDNYGNELAKFTDKGMDTKEIIVREKAQVTGLLFQEIDDQVWISKI